jgi:hypothetical protein
MLLLFVYENAGGHPQRAVGRAPSGSDGASPYHLEPRATVLVLDRREPRSTAQRLTNQTLKFRID